MSECVINTTVSNKPKLYTENNITIELIQKAFEYAEQETANFYEGRSCGVMDKEGKHSCPICHFRLQVKEYITKYIGGML